MDSVVLPLKDFAKNSVRLVKRCTKPDRRGMTWNSRMSSASLGVYVVSRSGTALVQSSTRYAAAQLSASWLWASSASSSSSYSSCAPILGQPYAVAASDSSRAEDTVTDGVYAAAANKPDHSRGHGQLVPVQQMGGRRWQCKVVTADSLTQALLLHRLLLNTLTAGDKGAIQSSVP